jgi:putative GTP pyrophosphokinase
MIEKAHIEKILGDFDRNKSAYDAFVRKIEHLVNELIVSAGYNPHTVTSRTKERSSLQKKLQKEDSTYKSLEDVTDITGVRVTTYFHDDVDRIAEVISKEFEILPEFSVDKRKALDPDQFGYLSLHYVVRLSHARRALPEYRRFERLRCEIQIRSILQHAWAEIEHDLGYKAKVEVPKDTRRQFSRLAGLLELADQEFSRIRTDLAAYEKSLPENIKERPNEVLLDKASLSELVRSDSTIREFDSLITSKLGGVLKGEGNYEMLLEFLSCNGIFTVAQLKSTISQNEDVLKKFAPLYAAGKKYETVIQGVSLLYLSYVLFAKSGNRSLFIEKANAFSLGNPEAREPLANRIMEDYAKALGS